MRLVADFPAQVFGEEFKQVFLCGNAGGGIEIAAGDAGLVVLDEERRICLG